MRTPLLRITLSLAVGLVVGCSSSESPTGVAEAFYDEMAAGNLEGAKSLSTPETAEMLSYIASMHDIAMFSVIAEAGASGELVQGENALVSFVEGGGYATVPLVKLDGEWKVDFATMIKAHMKKPEPVQLRL